MERNTIQRTLILAAVKELRSHATADELYSFVAKEHPSISRTTVYRNLQRLSKSGEIKKIEVPDSADRFDHNCHNHYHARCEKCGKVFDVDMKYMDDIEKHIGKKCGFEFTGHDIMFKGICAECKKAKI